MQVGDSRLTPARGKVAGADARLSGGLASVLPTPQLRAYVRHEKRLFPHSKMPPFSEILSPSQIDELVAYLQEMQATQ